MEYQIKLNDQELNILGKALGMMPYAEVAGVIQNLVNQINEKKTNDAPGKESAEVE